jgi:Glycosyl transferase 4-like domain
MVAFHFPPFSGSSGVQRTLRFVQHLPAYGWEPIVLSVQPLAFESTSLDLLRAVSSDVVVKRAFALDAARHLSFKGRYPKQLAMPDRWSTWRLSGVIAGLRLIRKYKPMAIWSTYPIPTAHTIARSLHRKTGLPWIADFRDPMVQSEYPENPSLRRCWQKLERTVVHESSAAVFCTKGAATLYRNRYPEIEQSRIHVIENGFDEESFSGVQALPFRRNPLNELAITLLHSGVVYASERDPTNLFAALERIRYSDHGFAMRLKIRFRASGADKLLAELALRYKVADMVEMLPQVAYSIALEEMLRADGLLILQAANCNEQIPAKLYEYFRAGRPIMGLTSHIGDTAALLRSAGINDIASLDSAEEIELTLRRFVGKIREGTASIPSSGFTNDCSRRIRARELSRLLDDIQTRDPVHEDRGLS